MTAPSLAARATAQAHGHAVSVRGASKRYGALAALAGIDVEVAAGEFLVLLGPSGSGKSTLARCLAGIERLDEGVIRFGSTEMSRGRRHVPPERRNLAMVFQDYALWPHMTVTGNVGYALRRLHLASSEARRRTDEALDRVGLAALGSRYPHELSGGEQQRVALARAVVARPRLLLFDEPLSNLDADLRERLRVEISTLVRESGATAVYITHDQAEAFALADTIGVLNHGRLVQLGDPQTIYHDPTSTFVARFTGLAGEFSGRVVGVDGRHAVVRVPGGDIAARRATEHIAPGDQARVLIRPAATRLRCLDNQAVPHDAGLATALPATVIDVAYRGRGYDHVVDCGGSLLASVFATLPSRRGDVVQVELEPAGCLAFRAADDSGVDSVHESRLLK